MIKVTLLVKGGPAADAEITRRLNEWFTDGPHDPPFPPGTLLNYSIHDDDMI